MKNETHMVQPDHCATSPLAGRAVEMAFLAALRRTGNSALACKESGLTRRQINAMKKRDEDFSDECDEALEDAADLLEAEAWRRALDGIEQPLLKAGLPVLDPTTGKPMKVVRYSDPLLVMLLRGHKPGRFSRPAGSGAASLDAGAILREIAADHDPPRAAPIS